MGIIGHVRTAAPATRRQARLSMTAGAGHAGYAVVEVFELDGRLLSDDAALIQLERTASDAHADVLLVVGQPDPGRIRDIARRHAMTVVELGRPEQAVADE